MTALSIPSSPIPWCSRRTSPIISMPDVSNVRAAQGGCCAQQHGASGRPANSGTLSQLVDHPGDAYSGTAMTVAHTRKNKPPCSSVQLSVGGSDTLKKLLPNEYEQTMRSTVYMSIKSATTQALCSTCL